MTNKEKLRLWIKYCMVSLIIIWAVCFGWVGLELLIYGKVQPRFVDDIIGGILIFSLCFNYVIFSELRRLGYIKLKKKANMKPNTLRAILLRIWNRIICKHEYKCEGIFSGRDTYTDKYVVIDYTFRCVKCGKSITIKMNKEHQLNEDVLEVKK